MRPLDFLVLAVFREPAKLRGACDIFDTKHNRVWVISPSSGSTKALLDVSRKRDPSVGLALTFVRPEPSEADTPSAGEDTRLLGAPYGDLSKAMPTRSQLLQTPEFVEEFSRAPAPVRGHRDLETGEATAPC